jgi:hypothetical protein
MGPPDWILLLWEGGARLAAVVALNAAYAGLTNSLFMAVALAFFTLLLRRRSFGVVALTVLNLVVLYLTTSALTAPVPLTVAQSAIVAALFVLLLVRFGLLATVGSFAVFHLLIVGTLRFDTAPYAAWAYVAVGLIAALSIYGFHTALGGRSLFGEGEIEPAVRAAR